MAPTGPSRRPIHSKASKWRSPGAGPALRKASSCRPMSASLCRRRFENYTLNSAYALHKDDRTGSLTLGKSADLVVVDRDVFKIPETEIAKTQVLLTLFAGEVVHGDLGKLSAPAAK